MTWSNEDPFFPKMETFGAKAKEADPFASEQVQRYLERKRKERQSQEKRDPAPDLFKGKDGK
jgi:hypothetical protein